MAKKFRDLVAAQSPAFQARVKARTQVLLRDLRLQELRKARQLSQRELAARLKATQPEISKIEHRTDLYVSTLRRYVQAAGGTLEITARFPDGVVHRLATFGEHKARSDR